MLSPLIQQVLADYRAELSTRFGTRLRRLAVFGSWARGEATEDSDLDVAVVVDDLTVEEWKLALEIGAEVQVRWELPFSPFVVSTARLAQLGAATGIADHIANEGINV